ncbi:hypothetical protein DRO42_06300 [Candidatus Bathyarchaeota archaeon]|nr:MAG: hypothetical protein DRO42_06300 [Candidatus Bathyarchaeota archaeon]
MRILSFEPASPLESFLSSGAAYSAVSVCPLLRYNSKRMPLNYIKWWKGRDNATKAKTIELVTKAICEACGCPPEAVTVIIQDIDKASWGRGGKPYA